MTGILVIDIGTTTLRAAVVDDRLAILALATRSAAPSTPFPGLVEFDADELARLAVDAAAEATSRADRPITAVGITNQRASTVVWDRRTGEPIGPGLGWQDLRTVMECIAAKDAHGLHLAPNQSATKVAWLLDHVDGARDRAGDLCFGTIDSWLAWSLSGGALHVTDHTNAAVTGLLRPDASAWNDRALGALAIPPTMMPELVPTSGVVGEATVLPGGPPIAALVGDQQGSLVGQGCVRLGQAKITFGSGGMLDLCRGPDAPESAHRSKHGTYPIIAWSRDGELTWGVEAIMLSAGTNVEWLREDLGLIDTPAASHDVAASVASADGVVFVPALLGLGTPHWDYGARGTLLGVTRGTTAAHVVRAVLEGVAQRGADLVEAAEADTGLTIERLRVDGGMSENPTFVQALADATGRPVEVSPVVDATALGAAFLAGLATGVWGDIGDAEGTWRPRRVVEPGAALDRGAWSRAVERAAGWIPELSALDF
jgi:glycerol kinase